MQGVKTQAGRKQSPVLTGADARDCAWAWVDALITAQSVERRAGRTRTADRLLDAASAMIASVEGANE